MQKIKLTWYGRCCFLIEINNKKILIDPHDQFDDVYMGIVDADHVLISSVAHDHGHIAASPNSLTHHEVGSEILESNIEIAGIMTKESRGTSNLIYNIKIDNFSITCFADLGDPQSLENLSQKDKKVLQSTNIAFVRPNQILHEPKVTSGELALRYCDPKIIIPYHFYPAKFIKRNEGLKKALLYLVWVDNMIEKLSYKKQRLDGCEVEIDIDDYDNKTAILFSDIHPQVVYKKE
ncbi:MAG: hypothetical protein CMI58_00870 [Parcubacteria group bacterium]|jgi:hypothetical protein|nr:hypothetical protein [Parcubacteria group bacterium]|tara:strand:+ start:1256 stop:1960 length:705 start_codon:yes stop_codon:yes gene_type:complete